MMRSPLTQLFLLARKGMNTGFERGKLESPRWEKFDEAKFHKAGIASFVVWFLEYLILPSFKNPGKNLQLIDR